MIQFRQKEFFWGMAALTALPMLQAHKQGKEQEEQSEKMQEKMEEQNRALNRIARNAAKNPQAAQQAAAVIQQRNESDTRLYSILPSGLINSGKEFLKNHKTLNTAAGFAKDMGKMAWNGAKGSKGITMENSAVMAATMAGGGYLANKAIQKDQEHMQDQAQQKSYAMPGGVGTVLGGIKKGADYMWKNHPKNLILGTAMGAAIPGLSYAAQRGQIKDQINQTAQNQTEQDPQQKTYASSAAFARLAKMKGTSGFNWFQRQGVNIKKGFNNFKKDPTGKIAEGISSWTGGTNKSGAQKMANTLQNSDNAWSKNVGKFMGDHKTLTVLGTAGAAGVGMDLAYKAGDKAVRGTASALDKNAYGFEKAQGEEIE